MKESELSESEYSLVPVRFIKELHNIFKSSTWTADSHRDVQNLIWLMIEQSESVPDNKIL